MKRFLVALTLCTALLTSCTKEVVNDDTQKDTPEMRTARTAIDETSKCLLSGQWKIGSYITATGDITKQYSSLVMNFTPIGHVIAFRSGVNSSGDWSVSYIDDKVRLGLTFTNIADLYSIGDNWNILACSTSAIKLQNIFDKKEILTLVK